MRIDLPDGQWAELRDRITHGAAKAVVRATRQDDLETMAAVTRAYVKAWEVRDPDGVPIGVDAPDAFDRLPSDVAQDIYEKVLLLWKAARDTSPTPPSSDA